MLCTYRFPEVEKLNPPILQLDSVSFTYENGPMVYKDIDLSVSQESRIALVSTVFVFVQVSQIVY